MIKPPRAYLHRSRTVEKLKFNMANSSTAKEAAGGEDLLTASEVLANEQANARYALKLLESKEANTCTFRDGYLRQSVFVCLTCSPADGSSPSGICFGCSLQCHQGHTVQELWKKRDFRCDCGNDTMKGFSCKLNPKEGTNSDNKYNHNFKNRYCACDEPWDEKSMMYQCVLCEDWYHREHMEIESTVNVEPSDDFFCSKCAHRCRFLTVYNGTIDKDKACELCRVVPHQVGSDTCVSSAFVLKGGWLDYVCKCEKCTELFSENGLSFLFSRSGDESDDDDSVEAVDEAAEGNEESAVVDRAVETFQNAPQETKMKAAMGYAAMKEAIYAQLKSLQESGQTQVTAEHINNAMENVTKRRKL